MTLQDWLNIFKKHNDIKIFHINHLKLFTSLNDHALRVSLSRLNKNNSLKRICRGFYANPFNIPTLEEISGQIYQPSYISLESALSSYGILNQIPHILTCVTTQFPHTFKTSFGTIEYRQIKKEYFWGFIEKNGFLMAEQEKAFVDYIYLNSNRNKTNKMSLLNLKDINMRKVKRYLCKINMKKAASMMVPRTIKGVDF
ncbi:MAG: hypothetical protein ABH872_06675 [Candidatus Omnitrophota bacterium]